MHRLADSRQTAEQQADERHENIIYQRSDDLAERTAYENADSHVKYVALQSKFLKFLQH